MTKTLNFIHNIINFIKQFKSYIIISLIIFFSVISIVVQNINENKTITINDETIQSCDNDGMIGVYISGEVENPGVYYLEEDTRLTNLIDMCGGFTNYADISDLNLAEKLEDCEKIYVPRITESDEEFDEDVEAIEELSESSTTSNDVSNIELININTASKDELQTLSGIGEATAQKIIEYRSQTKFETIEDIMNVSGIGESKFDAIKEYICVN